MVTILEVTFYLEAPLNMFSYQSFPNKFQVTYTRPHISLGLCQSVYVTRSSVRVILYMAMQGIRILSDFRFYEKLL